MPIRSIMVALDPTVEIETLLDGALKIANRMEGHLDVLLLQPEVTEVAVYYPAMNTICPLEELELDGQRSAEAMKVRFEAWRDRQGLPDQVVNKMLRTTYARWSSWKGPPTIGLLRRGRLADLIVMAKPRTHAGLDACLVDAAMFDSGRPLLLIPGASDVPLLERVAVAWNSSLPAVRSLAAARPFLHEAGRVDILAAATPHSLDADPSMISAEDVVEALSWQGVQAAAVHVVTRSDEALGAALLREAKALEISLLALGAFTHSRIRGAGVGGVTGYMLENSQIPLLMTH